MKETSIEITLATPEDAESIENVFYKTWLATYPNEEAGITIDDIEDFYKDAFSEKALEGTRTYIANQPTNEIFLVARDSAGMAIGVCRVIRNNTANQLQAIYVLPEYQGMGVGTKLWEKMNELLESDIDIIVDVATYNKGAIDFYKRIGFEDTGERFQNPNFRMKSGATIPEMRMKLTSTKI